ncbi:thioredoxin domain-containing protein [Alteribacter natronophilus]|uniref:thioredoxin domain-containing protein n=1 Tax=Alteribacter natronophilus TaxID=2583810 RepID=UPI00110EED17|nr:thioredoxin domain-containing protein [Alteribacter natronophilus]TMW73032.1 thioredoxin [Alteribacter natronophilus]
MLRTKMLIFSGVLAVIWLCSGCDSARTSADHSLLGKENETVTVLFSDKMQAREEADYYDAILDLHRTYSDEINPVKIIEADESDLIASYEIERFPTLVIIEDNKVTKKIEGDLSSDQILSELKSGLRLNRAVDEPEENITYLNRSELE